MDGNSSNIGKNLGEGIQKPSTSKSTEVQFCNSIEEFTQRAEEMLGIDANVFFILFLKEIYYFDILIETKSKFF